MASTHKPLLHLLLLVASISICFTQTHASEPKSIVLSISKDTSSFLYLTETVGMGTPVGTKSLVVDLRGSHLWIDCDGYRSSTFKLAPCGSPSCALAKSAECNNNTCYVMSKNTLDGVDTEKLGEVARDTIALLGPKESNGAVTIPDYIFSCVNTFEMDAFPNSVWGMLGLGRDQIGFPTQVASAVGGAFAHKFAICLPANSTANGVMLLGDYSYKFHSTYIPNTTNDISYRIAHTKLYLKGDDQSSPEYIARVTSIYVNDIQLSFNTTSKYFETTFSTTIPYTTLETSIYKTLIKAFDKEIISGQKVKKVNPYLPFRDCYTKGLMEVSSVGLSAPQISFVFESKKVYWPFYGANTMVQMDPDTVCLGIMDGGPATTTPIVIGALQMENSLVEFDLAKSQMGFTSTLILGETECSSYKL